MLSHTEIPRDPRWDWKSTAPIFIIETHQIIRNIIDRNISFNRAEIQEFIISIEPVFFL